MAASELMTVDVDGPVGARPALLAPGLQPLTYLDLARHVDEVGAALTSLGVGPDDCVVTMFPEGPDAATAFVGVSSTAACAPLNPRYTRAELEFYLSDLRPAVALVSTALDTPCREVAAVQGVRVVDVAPSTETAGRFTLPGIDTSTGRAPGPSDPGRVALMLHTSGTTARPKLVPLTHANLAASTRNITTTLGLGPDDRCLNVMPLFHIHGIVAALLSSLRAGGSVVCTPGFRDTDFLGWLDELSPTWYTAVPTIHQAALAAAGATDDAIASSLRFIRSSSAALPPQVLADLERVFGVPVVEAYGMTEATHQMASNPLGAGPRKPGTVGPAAGPEIAILGRDGTLLGPGEAGEIVIRGDNVMTGYRSGEGDPNATAFVDGWFRTGDEGVLDGDGYLTITSRLKEIINRGGEKVAPREVEEVLLAHPAIAKAAAFAIPHPTLGEEVGAAIVLRDGASASPDEVRSFAAARLAPFKVPRRVLVLDEIPLGPTGKIQRVGMAARLGLDQHASTPGREPSERSERGGRSRSPLEVALAGLWADVLGVDDVGDDDFFLIGGDSLAALRLLARVTDAFGVDLPVESVFHDANTVAGMADLIRRTRDAAPTARLPIPRATAAEAPASPEQRSLWFLAQMDDDASRYNVTLALRLRGPLDLGALGRAVDEVVRRHDVLRTTFHLRDGELIAVVGPPQRVELAIDDLSAIDAGRRVAAAQERAALEAQRPFDLERDLLVRARVLELDADDHVLLVGSHHTVCDGWSRNVMRAEIVALYEAFVAGAPSPLPEPPFAYRDIAAWQQARLAPDERAREIEWWTSRLAGAPPVDLPTDRPRRGRRSRAGAIVETRLDRDTADRIRAIARDRGSSLFMALLTAFDALVHRYTGETDLVVGTPVARRQPPPTEDMVGPFAATLPLRVDVSGELSFTALLERVREVCLDAYAHQTVSFETIVERLNPDRSRERDPLVQVTFGLRNIPARDRPTTDLTVEPFDFDPGLARFELHVDVVDDGGDLRCVFEYSTDRFDGDAIGRLARHFRALVEAIAAEPDRPLHELPLVGDDDRRLLLDEWSGRGVRHSPAGTIHERFAAQVRRAPDAIAVVDGEHELTYAALDARADRLAARLRSRGVGPGVLVGICAPRSARLIVGLVGILKAGGAYVPLDPDHPAERLQAMADHAGAHVVLTDADLDDVHDDDSAPDDIDLPAVHDDDLAYVIHTSGSTGEPKGVMIEHRAVVGLVVDPDYVTVGPDDVVAQASNASFDAATFEIWGALLNGARLVITPRDVLLSPADLHAHLERHRVSVLWVTAGLFNQIAALRPQTFRSVRTLLFGGERADARAVRAVLDAAPPARLINGYGPTECTTFTTWHLVESVDGDDIPIGRPLAGTQCYVLDRHGRLVPPGVPGELHVAGPRLARGYLHDPALTAQRFVTGTGDLDGLRLYRTGDLVRHRHDGALEFIGRTDDQVKIRGFRVEPAEVEVALRRHPAVRHAAVVTHEDAPGERRLVAYAELRGAAEPGTLRAFLQRSLPAFMVPSHVVVVDRLPLNLNGKVDRHALPPPPARDASTGHDKVAPRDETEATMARLWAEVLEVDQPVGVTDDFFDLGGHSLLAVRLLCRAEDEFGRRLPLSTLFEEPTVEHLAAAVRGQREERGATTIVPVQPDGARPPLFTVHLGEGGFIAMRRVATALGDDQPVLGLWTPGLTMDDAGHQPLRDLASSCLAAMREVQPQGPYFLLGHSVGGLVVWEMTRQLGDTGERVPLLAMVDTIFPAATSRLAYVRRHLFTDPGVLLKAVRRRLRFARDSGRQATETARKARAGGEGQGEGERGVDWDAVRRRVREYRPGRVDAGIVLFTSESSRRTYHDRFLGWRRLLPRDAVVVPLPGNHVSILREPIVDTLAEELAVRLRSAQSTG